MMIRRRSWSLTGRLVRRPGRREESIERVHRELPGLSQPVSEDAVEKSVCLFVCCC